MTWVIDLPHTLSITPGKILILYESYCKTLWVLTTRWSIISFREDILMIWGHKTLWQESTLIKKVFFILTRHGIKINVGYFWSIQAKDWALGRSIFRPACGLSQTVWVDSILKYGTKSLLKGYAEKTIEEKHALKSLFVGFNEVFFERCGVATGDQINYSFIFMRFSSDYRVFII